MKRKIFIKIFIFVLCGVIFAFSGCANIVDKITNGIDQITNGIDQIFCDHETTEIVAAVEPTCTETGYTEYERCVDCGKEVTKGKEIPAGHTLKTITGYAATCTTMGLSDGKECTVCKETVESQKLIPANGHTLKTGKGKAATCTESGVTEYKYCTYCMYISLSPTIIPALGHTFENGVCVFCHVKSDFNDGNCSFRLMNVGDMIAGKTIRLYIKEGFGRAIIFNNGSYGFGVFYNPYEERSLVLGIADIDGNVYETSSFPEFAIGNDYVDITIETGVYTFNDISVTVAEDTVIQSFVLELSGGIVNDFCYEVTCFE